MGRIIKTFLVLPIVLLLTACPLKDWIRADNENVSVDEFKRITKVVSVSDQSGKAKQDEVVIQSEISQLFFLLSKYNNSSEKEKNILFNKIKLSFKQNPTLLNALFLSMIEVTNEKNNDKLTLDSNLMKAIDMTKADADLLELMKLFKIINSVQVKQIALSDKIKLYKTENAKYRMVVKELSEQISALKNIEESIYARELVLENQEQSE